MSNRYDGSNKSGEPVVKAQLTPEQEAEKILAEEKLQAANEKKTVHPENKNSVIGTINAFIDMFNKVDIEGNKLFDKLASTVSLSLTGRANTPESGLTGEAKVLENAFKTFSENGITADEKNRLEAIDVKLKHASIQLTDDGGASITDDEGHGVKIKPKNGRKI